MYSDYTIYMIACARHKERLQEAERDRLFRSAEFRQPAHRGWFWHITGVVVARLRQSGAKLLPYGPTHPTVAAGMNLPITHKEN